LENTFVRNKEGVFFIEEKIERSLLKRVSKKRGGKHTLFL